MCLSEMKMHAAECEGLTETNPEVHAMPGDKSPVKVTVKKRAPRKAEDAAKMITSATQFVGPEQRAALIAEAAYLRAEQRGFAPGHEVEDWLAAESEVDARLMHGTGSEARV